MKAEDSEDERLFDEALRLAFRLREAPDDAESREVLRLWRARSPAHEAAWRELAEIHGLTGRALAGRRRGATRRRILIGAAGLGAAASVAAWGPGALIRARADLTTEAARIAAVETESGRLLLGPKSALALEPRGARLLEGMVWREAAPLARAPFRLAAGSVEILDFSGELGVSLEAGVLTAESAGRAPAEIRPLGAPEAAPVLLQGGVRLRFDSSGALLERASRSAPPASWLEGRLIAEAEPLGALVERIARWLPERVMLLGSDLGARRVSGVFDLSAPREALEAAVRPHGGRLRDLGVLGALLVTS